MKHNPSQKSKSAFSLIELIAVISIIVIIAAFAVPAANTILRGSQLTQGAQMISGQLSLARQQALTRNHAIEIRIFRFADSEQPGEDAMAPDTGKYRAIQMFEVLENGVAVPLSKVERLPNSIVFNDQELSTIIKEKTPQEPRQSDPELPRGVKKAYQYVSFRFRPDGSTDLNPIKQWFVTLHSITDIVEGTQPPPNFFTVQIDPVSGATRDYRPNAT
jgi:uncharacterized protein (TIGR02596 family)